MAFWGAGCMPTTRRAVDAAVAIVASLRDLNADHAARGLPAVSVGIGLNTGVMSVGNMGSGLAARLHGDRRRGESGGPAGGAVARVRGRPGGQPGHPGRRRSGWPCLAGTRSGARQGSPPGGQHPHRAGGGGPGRRGAAGGAGRLAAGPEPVARRTLCRVRIGSRGAAGAKCQLLPLPAVCRKVSLLLRFPPVRLGWGPRCST